MNVGLFALNEPIKRLLGEERKTRDISWTYEWAAYKMLLQLLKILQLHLNK